MKQSILDTYPENRDRVAVMFANGIRHKAIAEEFDVHVDTVGVWKKRPDVQAITRKYIEDRASAILSHTDTAILKRLEQARDADKPLPVEVLLRIRQTFAGEKIDLQVGDKSGAVAELLEAIHENPELAKALGLAAVADEQD